MLHGICRYSIAVFIRRANHGPWASCLAHLSQRLRMSYCDHSPSVVCLSIHTVEQLLLWNPWPVFFKLHVVPSVKRWLKVCTNGHSPSPSRYMVKTLKNLLLQNQESFGAESWYIASDTLRVYQICSNDDPRLTFDLFTTRSNLCPYAFVWGKYWKVIISKSIKD